MPDSCALAMLSNIRKAMSPDSRLLIRESIPDMTWDLPIW